MLARLHRGLELQLAKTGRCAEQHHVDAALDRLPVGVQAHEPPLFGHVDTILESCLDVSQAAFQRILEGVGHGHQFHVGLGGQRIGGGARAPSSAADQGDLDRIATGGVHITDGAEIEGYRRCRRGRGLQKLPPRRGIGTRSVRWNAQMSSFLRTYPKTLA